MTAERARGPVVLLHVQQFRGTGHRVRIGRLATALHDHFRVVVLDGGPPEPAPVVPPGVDWRWLEPLFRDPDRVIRPLRSELGTADVLAARRRVMIDTVDETRPAALLIEFYPFARSILAPELEAGIERVRSRGGLVVSSIRDLPTSRFENDDPASGALRHRVLTAMQSIDALFVHTDPALIETGALLPWLGELPVPVLTTGLIAPHPPPPRARRGMVVSMGGGLDGLPLGLAALEAWERLRHGPLGKGGIRLHGGPYLPAGERESLRLRCAQVGATWVDFAPGFVDVLAGARVSVSRAGYNTVADVLASGVHAVLVPTRANDQPQRAELIAAAGHAVVADDEARSITDAVTAALAMERRRDDIDLGGAGNTCRWLRERLQAGHPASGTTSA